MRLPASGIYIAVLSSAVVLLASKGISDEGTVSLNGDMPRHMMNGVYFYDVMRDLPFDNLVEYTLQYFAKYPALSIGHHPVLTSVAEAPFYALLGISVASARWTIVSFTVLAVIAWFFLIRSAYGELVALLSSLLFATSPIIVGYSRIVMTEIPALALIVVSSYFYFRLCDSGETRYRLAFVLSFTMACYAKQLAIFMLPVFVLHWVTVKGPRTLMERRTILTLFAIGFLLAPLVVMTIRFSPSNVGFVTGQPVSEKLEVSRLLFYIQTLWKHQLTPPVAGLAFLSLGMTVLRRQTDFSFFLFWILATYALAIYLGLQEPRLAIYWVPAFCFIAAAIVEGLPSRAWRVSLTGIVAVLIGYQFAIGYAAEPEYAAGFEEAASYVVENRKGATVLFSSNIDSGYFVFFVRKKDPSRQMVILRANKVVATSQLSRIVEERISDRAEIYEILKDFGTCYVVLQDTPYESRALEWLREEVSSDRFVLRRRIPLRSRDPRLQGVSLGVYEYNDCGPADPNAILDMNLPLIRDSIQVRLGDVMSEPPR